MNFWAFLGIFAGVLIVDINKKKMIEKYNREKKMPKLEESPIVLKDPDVRIKKIKKRIKKD